MRVCNTWEDYVWVFYNAIVEDKLEQVQYIYITITYVVIIYARMICKLIEFLGHILLALEICS